MTAEATVRGVRLPILIAVLGLAAALTAGCGGDDTTATSREAEPVTLSLDFTPNAVHAPIYAAARDGRDEREGVELKIRKPGPGPDALKLITAGKVDLGVLDIHDLAIAREHGADLVAIGALVGKPLAALIGQPELHRPRDLEKVKQVTIGFAAVARLLSRRVDAVPAFWNAEGVALKRRGREVAEFRVDDYGAPPYPEVVLVTSRRTLDRERDRLHRTLKAIAAGMQAKLDDT